MSKYNITDESHLTSLDASLKDNLYIGGHSPNAEDALVFEQFAHGKTEPNQDKHPNLWAWFSLIILFRDPIRESWKAQAAVQAPKGSNQKKPAEKKEEPKPAAKAPAKDDDDDLFGDDGDDSAALEALKKKKEQEKLEKEKKKKKEAPIAKSLVLLDIKVWEPEQDLDELASRVIKIEKDGLLWKTEYRLDDVAFGVKKIVIGMTVEDAKVSVEDIIEELLTWEDDIQSIDIVAFNKI
jgi:elongation factor 1-beta